MAESPFLVRCPYCGDEHDADEYQALKPGHYWTPAECPACNREYRLDVNFTVDLEAAPMTDDERAALDRATGATDER